MRFLQIMIIWHFWVTLWLNQLKNTWEGFSLIYNWKNVITDKNCIRTQKTNKALTWQL